MDFVKFNRMLLSLSLVLPIICLVIGFNKILAIKKELLPILILNLNENHFLINFICSLFEFILLSLFYSFIIIGKITNAVYFMLAFFVVSCWLEISLNGINNINTFSSSSESILVIIYSLLLLVFVMKKMMHENLLHIPFFWINSGILIYYAGNLFLLALDNYIVYHEIKCQTAILNFFHSFFYMMYNIFLIIGFLKIKKV